MTAAQRRRRHTAAERYEARLAKKRKQFRYVEEGIPLYERPCGCPNGNYIPNGVLGYQYSSLVRTDNDLTECRQCGAVWTAFDIEPCLDRFRQERDLAMTARILGYELVPIESQLSEEEFLAEFEKRKPDYKLEAFRGCECCGEDEPENACGGFGDFGSDRYTYEHGAPWAPVNIGPHDVALPQCPFCHGQMIVPAVGCTIPDCAGLHPCEPCKGSGTLYNLT